MVFSRSVENRLKHLKIVFGLVAKHKLKLNVDKCEFAKTSVELLRHIFTGKETAVTSKII